MQDIIFESDIYIYIFLSVRCQDDTIINYNNHNNRG